MSSEVIESEKQKAIAEAAFQVFATHGFRKTSMQMIADQACMSRPALYLHFQSKEDVFSYLSISFFTKVADTVAAILARSGDPVDVLTRVFDAFDPDGVMAVLLDAQHGAELMDAKSNTMQGTVSDIEAGIGAMLADWLALEADAGRILCDDPNTTAQTIMLSHYGLKSPPPSYAIYKARTAQLARLLGKGLRI
ncbi:MAG: helix-turn-helix domain-containing protein [Planktotalea sp.]|uniref:TetR/AcrR family transcriptional regulator n=1 Tax=Planktotalea sp. TaxID=2029877 RepID=UPI003C7109C0